MPEPAPIAVDTTVLLWWAEDSGRKTVARLHEKFPGSRIIVTPASIAELECCLGQEKHPDLPRLARTVFASLLETWKFQVVAPAAFVPDAVSRHVAALVRANLLPPACRLPAVSIVEAALQGSRLLLSWDEDLTTMRGARLTKLRKTLRESGLVELTLMTPVEAVR